VAADCAQNGAADVERGFFVVLEGIDGAGKSEQCARLARALAERGERVEPTREPSDGPWGQRYRAWARGEFEASPSEILRFFVEDRREHLARVIVPALRAGRIVICDRYEASTRAYPAADGVERAQLDAAIGRAAARPPDLTLWLRLPVSQALARLRSGTREPYERAEFLERVDAEYAHLGLEAIDASPAPEQVARVVTSRVLAALRQHRARPAPSTG
jgi:dTMP kinase